MRRTASAAWLGWVVLAAPGCSVGPLQENPLPLGQPRAAVENPVYVAQGPLSYNRVFEHVLEVVDDFFPDGQAYTNRYDGRIESFPRIAPGLGQPWKPGSDDPYDRLLATFQSIRNRAVVVIQAADDGGFFVEVKVYQELEDLDRPIRQTAGAALFRGEPTVERQFEVVDASTLEPTWIPLGRNAHFEQLILGRIAHMNLAECAADK